MKGKMSLLVGGAVGYVLGTRAGRERYEQMKAKAQRFRQNPTVQQKAAQAQDYAREKAPEMQHKVADMASRAADTTKDEVGHSGSDDTTPQTYPNATTPTGGLGG